MTSQEFPGPQDGEQEYIIPPYGEVQEFADAAAGARDSGKFDTLRVKLERIVDYNAEPPTYYFSDKSGYYGQDVAALHGRSPSDQLVDLAWIDEVSIFLGGKQDLEIPPIVYSDKGTRELRKRGGDLLRPVEISQEVRDLLRRHMNEAVQGLTQGTAGENAAAQPRELPGAQEA
ncbi:MAG TPA: hypothetical protein VJP80_04345 [Candidatus Saccharimonadales bacterium]|nr:hypothetical protein [Candidatus Saccharimonadales bacterium]